MARRNETKVVARESVNMKSAPASKKNKTASNSEKNKSARKNKNIKTESNVKNVPMSGKAKQPKSENIKSTARTKKSQVARQETILVPIELLGMRLQNEDDEIPEKRERKKRVKAVKKGGRPVARETFSDDEYDYENADKYRTSRGATTTFIICVLLAATLVAGYFVFIVDTISIVGNERYSSELIIELSGLSTGRHTLLTDMAKAAANIESTPYIKVVDIKRLLPRTIQVTVKEREEAAVLLGQTYEVVIDVEGHVLTIGASTNPDGLLRVVGMSQHGFQVNKSIGASNDIQAATLCVLMQQLTALDMMDDVQELNMSNPLRVSLRTIDGIEVILGQADDLEEKLTWMKEALPSLRKSNIRDGTLDVSAKGGPIYSPPGTRVPGSGSDTGEEDESETPDDGDEHDVLND